MSCPVAASSLSRTYWRFCGCRSWLGNEFNRDSYSGTVHSHNSDRSKANRNRKKILVVRGANRKTADAGRVSSQKQKRQVDSGKKQSNSTPAKDPTLAMRDFAQDEHLMFVPKRAPVGSLSCIYAYPNEYTVGICSLGYQLVWAYLASRGDVRVARMFTDAHEDLPASPDLVGFSFSWELDYGNVMTLLDQLGVPSSSSERGDAHPVVFGGGPVLTANPEPFSSLFDVILMGDGEELVGDFLLAVDAMRAGAGSGNGPVPRLERLKALAQVPGVYVPALYQVDYAAPDGCITAIRPLHVGVPPKVEKRTYRGDTLASSSVISPRMAWENIFMVEVVRSCPEMCRFCLASYLTLPFRTAPVDDSLVPLILRGLEKTDRLGLLGASVTQHPEFPRLLDYLCQPQFDHVRLSIASVRAGTVTPELTAALARRGTRSLTIAVESGSQRMRQIINKKLDEEEILAAATHAQAGGLKGLKLYGMVGLPGEALLSRGDRRLGPLLQRVLGFGNSKGSFRRAFKELEGSLPPLDYYAHAQMKPGETILPWSHLLGPLPEATLIKHHDQAAAFF
eukprot:jgi/Mesvir1/13485/Mv16535-RA.2